MKNRLRLALLPALLCLLPLGCRSSSPAPAHQLACTCGTPEADLQGCPNASCLQGKRNPDNPDCVCGTLTISR